MKTQYFTIITLILGFAQGTYMPALLWDPKNPFFACEDPTITVEIGYKLNLVCPNTAVNYETTTEAPRMENLYEMAYLLQPNEVEKFENCNATGAKRVLKCDNQDISKIKYSTLSIKEFAGSPSIPTFQPGKTYFLIGTAFRTSANKDNLVGGSCSKTDSNGPYKLKMKLKVCSTAEVNTNNCTKCSTASCYSKGCTSCTDWSKTPEMMRSEDGHCHNFYQRNCTNSQIGFTYKDQKVNIVSCPATQPPPLTSQSPTTQTESTQMKTTPSGPNHGERTGENNDDRNVYLIGGLSAVLGLLLGVVVGVLLYKTFFTMKIKSSKLKESVKDNRISLGIDNFCYNSQTINRNSPGPILKNAPDLVDQAIEIECDPATGKTQSSKDQKC